MKIAKSMMAAAVFAAASFGASAYAADISQAPEALAVIDNTAFFGDTFTANNNANTFADHLTFSVTSMPATFNAIVASISGSADTGLDISNLGLYTSTGTLVTSGTLGSSGAMDIWTLNGGTLAVGNYYLQVSGSMVSNTGGSFGGSVMLQPVPEPETYGMMLAGLGVVGLLARRRKATK